MIDYKITFSLPRSFNIKFYLANFRGKHFYNRKNNR
jgi:hypothetical protein